MRPAAIALLGVSLTAGAAPARAADAAKGPAMTENQIAALDGDRDGRITRAEAASRKDLLERWPQLDRNGDQALEAAEISGTGGGTLGE